MAKKVLKKKKLVAKTTIGDSKKTTRAKTKTTTATEATRSLENKSKQHVPEAQERVVTDDEEKEGGEAPQEVLRPAKTTTVPSTTAATSTRASENKTAASREVKKSMKKVKKQSGAKQLTAGTTTGSRFSASSSEVGACSASSSRGPWHGFSELRVVSSSSVLEKGTKRKTAGRATTGCTTRAKRPHNDDDDDDGAEEVEADQPLFLHREVLLLLRKDEADPNVLFVTHLDDLTEHELKCCFQQFGEIESLVVKEMEQRASYLKKDGVVTKTAFALVRFDNSQSVREALQKADSGVAAAQRGGPSRSRATSRIVNSDVEEEREQNDIYSNVILVPEIAKSLEENSLLRQALLKLKKNFYPDPAELQQKYDKFMHEFEKQQEEREKQLKQKQNVPDEDGFVLVDSKKAFKPERMVGGPAGPAAAGISFSQNAAGGGGGALNTSSGGWNNSGLNLMNTLHNNDFGSSGTSGLSRKQRRKKEKKLENFYNFQVKEKRAQEMKLEEKKFDEFERSGKAKNLAQLV
ncbi:unnamed protein product [Amoebophrya sp. A120]|nr:unnamed protein product [Amoebophrya sp. A120]|eukprot:GSA120T00009230001.1